MKKNILMGGAFALLLTSCNFLKKDKYSGSWININSDLKTIYDISKAGENYKISMHVYNANDGKDLSNGPFGYGDQVIIGIVKNDCLEFEASNSWFKKEIIKTIYDKDHDQLIIGSRMFDRFKKE